MVAIGIFTVAGIVMASAAFTVAYILHTRQPHLREIATGIAVVAGAFSVFIFDMVVLPAEAANYAATVVLAAVSVAWAAGMGIGLTVIGVGIHNETQARKRRDQAGLATVEMSRS